MAIDPRDKAHYEQRQKDALAEAAQTEARLPSETGSVYSNERCGIKPTPDPRHQLNGAQSGEPVATLHDDGYWVWKGTPPHGSNYAGWRMDVYAAPQPAQTTPPDAAEFKNFHRLLCERFGYTHDDKDWKRDQLSLIEWIAAAPQPERAPTTEQIGALEKAVGLLWGLGKHADARTLRDLIPAAQPANGGDRD